ncbi:hypothetical protein [Clostridium tarantellae]|uniref:Uncharacterized protein n=1 Tax=Clostridium tarantellae TaxID=39493 RepID=A0A6I1MPL6_9CLOT|nr:hypothetical protein [Clostridium tarantellae]MPQ45365.1 hypothetical protein [Clostridium tarantellae]
MSKLKFKNKVRFMSLLSFISTFSVIFLIIALILKIYFLWFFLALIYFICTFIEDIIWKCPNCNRKLPKEKPVYYIEKCIYCNYNLK